MDNTNVDPPKLLLFHAISFLEKVWVPCHELIIYDCHKRSVFHHKSLFDHKIDHLNPAETSVNTPQNAEFFDFYWVHIEPIYRISSPC